jgi:BNR repeat-containing family member
LSTVGIDAAWSWFNDPHVVCQRTPRGVDWMHVGYVASNGDVGVASHDVASGRTTHSILHEALEADDHDPASLVAMADGTLLACYSRHEPIDGFYRRRTADAEDPGSWGPEARLLTGANVVYPKPVRFASGRLVVVYRRNARSQHLIFSDDDGASWSTELPLIANGNQRPYVNLEYSPAADLIDVLYTDGHPAEQDNSLWHVTLASDGLVRATGGAPIRNVIAAGAIAHDEGTLVYDVRGGDGRAWGWGICRDPLDIGSAYAVFARFPAAGDHRYCYARWDGATWQVNRDVLNGSAGPSIYPGGPDSSEPFYSGGIDLLKRDPSVVFVSRRVAATWRIERWRRRSPAFVFEETIAADRSVKNVRPVCPSFPGLLHTEPPDVVWMAGSYTSYTDYRTELAVGAHAS